MSDQVKNNPLPRNLIPTAHLPEVFAGIEESKPLTLHSSLFSFDASSMPLFLPYEYLVLAAIVRHLVPQQLFEFGTALGRSTLLMAANSPERATVTTIDLPPSDLTDYSVACMEGKAETGALLKASEFRNKVQFLYADSRRLNARDIKNKNGPMDFILVDGDHSYAGVKADSECAFALSHERTVFLWHDFYMFPEYVTDKTKDRGVFPYLNELAAQKRLRLYNIMGTYFVVGSVSGVPEILREPSQPEAMPSCFGKKIVRLRDTAG